MRKTLTILFLVIFLGSCSVFRNRNTEIYINQNISDSGNILESVKNQNITAKGFFIEKAEIEISTQNGKQKFIGNVKFEYPDKYLISIRSRSGIEGARLYISGDSVLVNDRINKKMYIGNSFYFKRKYGLNQKFLPLIFGDIVEARNCEKLADKCVGDKLNLDCEAYGVKLNYDIDCKRRKTIVVNQINDMSRKEITITYEKFFGLGSILVPGIVELEDSKYNTKIRIKYLKVESPWKGSIKFIPGKGYELIELI